MRWPVIAGAAAAAVVVMAVAVSWQPVAPEQITVRAGTDVVLTMPTREPARPQVGADQTIESRPARAVPRSVGRTVSGPAVARASSGPRSPEVLISRDEQRGLESLLTAVRDGRLTPSLASQLVAADAASEVTEIALPDIVIQPLQQYAVLEGEGQ